MRPRVNTEKHYVQYTVTSVAAGAKSSQVLVEGVAAPSATYDVREGAVVTAVYVEIWITLDDAAQGSFNLNLEKGSTQMTQMSYANSIALHSYPNKKNVFFTTQGLVGPNVQVPTPAFRGWIKVPKSKQRFGLGDRFYLNLSGITNGINYCGFVTYKEQF